MGAVADIDFETSVKSAKLPTEVISALKSKYFISRGALFRMTEVDISDLNLGKKGLVRFSREQCVGFKRPMGKGLW